MKTYLKKTRAILLAATGAAFLAHSASAQQIFWANTGGFGNPGGGSIWTLDVGAGTGPQQIVSGLHRPIGVTVYNGSLYWAEDGHDSATSRIGTSNLDGSSDRTVFSGVDHSFTNAQKLVIDSTGQIFWTDYVLGVNTGNVNGTGYRVLGGGGSAYTSIDLDRSTGQVYYGDPTNNGMLYRMNSDETHENVAGPLTAGNWEFNSHVIDQVTGDLYYSDTAAHTINRLGDGTPVVSGLTSPFGIALLDDYFYWVGGGNLGRVGVDGLNAEILASGIDGTAFGVTVIPEPGTYAAIFGLFAGLLVLIRRRFRS